jgi:putative ABC transport system substrate-binding protein
MSAEATLAEIREVAPKLNIELMERPIRGSGQLEALFASFPENADALFLPRDSTIEAQIAPIVRFATAHRLPLCVPSLTQVEAGALLSYGFVHREIGRQAARLADQILRGTKPADLPVETAENYLAINLRTAEEIGLPIPDHVLKQASILVRQ